MRQIPRMPLQRRKLLTVSSSSPAEAGRRQIPQMQYVLKDGTLAKDGLFEIEGKRYLFSEDGFIQT
jgi:hypothetical protein